MGYYTSYSLQVRSPNMSREMADEIEAALKAANVIGYALGHCCYSENQADITRSAAYFDSRDYVKWYEHEEVMTEISQKFPSATFLLEGQGEEHDDQWEKYFLNGETEECYPEITWPKPMRIKWPPEYPLAPNTAEILSMLEKNGSSGS